MTRTDNGHAPVDLRKVVTLVNTRLEEFLLMITFTVILILIGSEVINRYVFNSSIAWAQEVAIYLYVFMSWMGASYAVRRRLHLSMDLIQSKMTPKLRIAVISFNNVLFLVLMGFVVYYGQEVALLQRNYGRTLFGMPSLQTWYFYILIPITGALIMVRILQRMYQDLSIFFESEEFITGEPLFVPTEEE